MMFLAIRVHFTIQNYTMAKIWPEMMGKVIYHLLTDRFRMVKKPQMPTDLKNPLAFHGGNYEGIRQAMQEGFFSELGVDIIQMSPPYEQVEPQWDNQALRLDWGAHGYWPNGLKEASSRFGALGNLVDDAEAYNMRLIFDMVHHVGKNAALYRNRPEWFTSSRTWFWNLPELNLGRQDVKSYVFRCLKRWNPKGDHHFRWDTLHHLPPAYIRELFSAEDSSANGVWSVGEVLHGDPKELRRFLDLGCPSVYNYPLWYCLSEELSSREGNLGKVAEVFGTMFGGDTFHPAELVNFAQNHDMDLLRSLYLAKGASDEESLARLKMALTLVFFVPGIPSIYYLDATAWSGQNFSDPNRSGRWNLDWSNKGIFYYHLACLVRARKSTSALSFGSYKELWKPGDENREPIFAFERRIGTNGSRQVVVVVVNNDTKDHEVSIPVGSPDGNTLEELMAEEQDFIIRDGNLLGRIKGTSVLALALP
jgi:neopullulanase